MKKIAFALCLVMALFCSCQENNNDPEIPQNPLLGSWELGYWETYNLDNNEMLESGVEVPDDDWFTSLNIKENTCEIGFGGETVEVQYTVINNSLVFIVEDNNYSLTLPIVSLSGERLTISMNEFFNDGSGNEVNGKIMLYYDKK